MEKIPYWKWNLKKVDVYVKTQFEFDYYFRETVKPSKEYRVTSTNIYSFQLDFQENISNILILSVRLWTNWFWIPVLLQSLEWTLDMAPVSSKEFLDIKATIECGFTLKWVSDKIKTYNQVPCTDKYSQNRSTN